MDTLMKSKSVKLTIKNKSGIHARPASIFVREASKCNAEISVKKEDEVVNGKSLIGLLMLAASYNTTVTITATGKDYKEAITTLKNLVTTNAEFNELEKDRK